MDSIGQHRVVLNPPTQYANDRNLGARRRFWEASTRDPEFALYPWVLDRAGITEAPLRILDIGCGNGTYEALIARRSPQSEVVAVDLSVGMLHEFEHPNRVQADAQALPFGDAAFDVVLAPHMLYHVPDVEAAAQECRRVTKPGGVFVAVTNGNENIRGYVDLVEQAVGTGWRMERPATQHFSLENGRAKLADAFDHVERIDCPPSDVVVTDVDLLCDYVASVEDHYAADASVPWADAISRTREIAQEEIDANGAIRWSTHIGAFVCR